MSGIDPNILNSFALVNPTIASPLSLFATIVSTSLSFVIAWYFLKSYRFTGFGYLLGLPVGFIFIAISFIFQHLNLVYSQDPVLNPAFFWVQLILQSEGFALIAASYQLKNAGRPDAEREISSRLDRDMVDSFRSHYSHARRKADRQARRRYVLISLIPLIMVPFPFILSTFTLASTPYFDYPRLADLSFYMRIFNMVALGYILKTATVSLVRAGNIRLLYIPAAFALFWLEQYSLVIAYFDNSTVSFMGSLIARLAALVIFVYVMRQVVTASRRVEEIETREKA
jgi:hypothetical protein